MFDPKYVSIPYAYPVTLSQRPKVSITLLIRIILFIFPTSSPLYNHFINRHLDMDNMLLGNWPQTYSEMVRSFLVHYFHGMVEATKLYSSYQAIGIHLAYINRRK